MAVVKDPFYSSDARGSVGGLTATRSGVGNVMKSKARPPQRRRPVQPLMRSILGWTSRQYGSLTAGQRAEWEAYATDHPYPDGFGGTFILTPEQMFIALNVVAIRYGGATKLQTSPPVDPPPATVTGVGALDGDESGKVDLTATLAGTGVATDYVLFQRAGPFQSPGRVEVHNRFRETRVVDGNVNVYSYEGLIPEMYYWFRARYVDEFGQVSNWALTQHKAPTVEV